MAEFRLPNTTQRTAVVGKTGSGKTQFGMWLLSHAAFDVQPYIIYDFKGEEFIQEIEYVQEIDLNTVPTEPGLYVVRPIPGQEDQVEQQLWKVWQQENVGLFIDECYMIDKYSKAFKACLTQGRSKHIPMYLLSQRPVQVDRFVFSEADFHAVFFLNDERDRDVVGKYMPPDVELDERLPEYYCRWYDVSCDQFVILSPVPDRASILERFNTRLQPPEPPKRRFI